MNSVKKYKFEVPTAVLGGGTGQFNLLRGLIKLNNPKMITAIPGTWDNGGSSGRLRTELGLLPPGDARRCLISLMENDEQREIAIQLFDDRLDGFSPMLDGHAVGNLVISNLEKANQGHLQGLNAARKLFRISSKIFPSTINSLTLVAKTKVGIEMTGEEEIDHRWLREDYSLADPIANIYFSTKAKANPEAVSAIKEAKLIVFSMGSLYGSILPHLLIPEIRKAILASKGKLILVMNMMTERGQTDSLYNASDHLKPFIRYLGNKNRLDCIIVNDNNLDQQTLEIYKNEGQIPVVVDDIECKKVAPKAQILKAKLASYDRDYHLLRHDPDRLAKAIYSFKKSL